MVEFLCYFLLPISHPARDAVHSTRFGASGDSSYFGDLPQLPVHQFRLSYTLCSICSNWYNSALGHFSYGISRNSRCLDPLSLNWAVPEWSPKHVVSRPV